MIARLEIDLDAIARNVARLRSAVRPAAFAAVVKANAYGHGAIETARAIERDVALLCTYGIDEAAALRAAGIAAPILVLGPIEPHDFGVAHETGAMLTLWSTGAYRRDLTRVARERGAPFGVHAKIDTGVARLGLAPDLVAIALASYLGDCDLDLRGVFTHLAAAEELESAFTREQLTRFAHALLPLERELRERGIRRHAAASAAAILYPESRLDMVRAGIAVYGIWPSAQTQDANANAIELEPALAWRTEIVAMRSVEAGRSVGYGCSYRTSRPSRIGVLPIGYAEGLPRALSGRGSVLVAGRIAPIVGRICMNMAFIDVTDIATAHTGSRVTLIGRDGDAVRYANDLAADAGTIGYEIVARLPREIPRSFSGGGQPISAMASARPSVPS